MFHALLNFQCGIRPNQKLSLAYFASLCLCQAIHHRDEPGWMHSNLSLMEMLMSSIEFWLMMCLQHMWAYKHNVFVAHNTELHMWHLGDAPRKVQIVLAPR